MLVGLSSGLLDLGQSADQVRVDGNRDAGDVEIFQRAQRVDAVIGLDRNLPVTEQVVFEASGNCIPRFVSVSYWLTTLVRGCLFLLHSACQRMSFLVH